MTVETISSLILGQEPLFGQPEVRGAYSGSIIVDVSDKDLVDEVIRRNHYSGTVVWSSNLHLLIFDYKRLIGAMQFGPAMNPASGDKIVKGSTTETWLELNRLWLDDSRPENTASRAISCAMRIIRSRRPKVEWIQSFADERCGKLGAVYQACSFLYCGEHQQTFYEIDGQVIHKSMLTRPAQDKRGWRSGPKVAWAKQNADRAEPVTYRQFRYIKFIRSRARKRLLLPVLPYPKP